MPEILKDKVGPQKQFHQHLDEGKFNLTSTADLGINKIYLNLILSKIIYKV